MEMQGIYACMIHPKDIAVYFITARHLNDIDLRMYFYSELILYILTYCPA